jgi:hypothetical protein
MVSLIQNNNLSKLYGITCERDIIIKYKSLYNGNYFITNYQMPTYKRIKTNPINRLLSAFHKKILNNN